VAIARPDVDAEVFDDEDDDDNESMPDIFDDEEIDEAGGLSRTGTRTDVSSTKSPRVCTSIHSEEGD
jgi:hypothetical protein